jgi:hypothetical protein
VDPPHRYRGRQRVSQVSRQASGKRGPGVSPLARPALRTP